jgi:AcrR family transcriptional regulator
MPDPRWQRRKTARPAEIIDAAFTVFSETGYAAARLEDIARRAGVSKAALYLYFETKEELFRAVVKTAIAPNLERIRATADNFDGPIAGLVPMLLPAMAAMIENGRIPAMVKMVIGESRNFPDLARIWHDDLLAPAIAGFTGVIARAQTRGEIRPGDPRLYVFSLIGPMLMTLLYRSVFAGIAQQPPVMNNMAVQHAGVFLSGALQTATKDGVR